MSDLVLTAATIKSRCCVILYICIQTCSQDGVGTSPRVTINGWKEKKSLVWLYANRRNLPFTGGILLVLLTLGYGEPLHGGELVAPGGVGDLQGADRLVAADHLPAHTLDTIQ